jgi:glucose/arabinose dehydrogenase
MLISKGCIRDLAFLVPLLYVCGKPSRLIMKLVALMLISVIIIYYSAATQLSIYGQELLYSNTYVEAGDPYVTDSNLTIETVATGLKNPTDMAFLSDDDILVLEKNDGTVRRVVNGTVLQEPLLDVAVATKDERGMLGIDIAENVGHPYVFLYYTEANEEDGEDLQGIEPPLGNRLYRYELDDDDDVNDYNNSSSSKLVNGTLLLDLPAAASYHNGGKIRIGPDSNLYITVGDQQDPAEVEPLTHLTTTQNVPKGLFPDGTAGILRLTQDGKPVDDILGGEHSMELYYAYGIRNSFGIDFDPVTGTLWDTEIGPNGRDEINIVEPAFNSGWRKIQGLADSPSQILSLVEFPGLSAGQYSIVGLIEELSYRIQGLGGKYSDPELVWEDPITPTAIKFLDSKLLGGKYQNDIFVGSFNHGTILHFHLNEQRGALYLRGPLQDKVENNPQGYAPTFFGKNFGRVVDLEVGQDGYLYVLSLAADGGKIYRIFSKSYTIHTIT